MISLIASVTCPCSKQRHFDKNITGITHQPVYIPHTQTHLHLWSENRAEKCQLRHGKCFKWSAQMLTILIRETTTKTAATAAVRERGPFLRRWLILTTLAGCPVPPRRLDVPIGRCACNLFNLSHNDIGHARSWPFLLCWHGGTFMAHYCHIDRSRRKGWPGYSGGWGGQDTKAARSCHIVVCGAVKIKQIYSTHKKRSPRDRTKNRPQYFFFVVFPIQLNDVSRLLHTLT